VTEAARPLVFVTVGTDHHPFDRLVDWIDRWMSAPDREQVRCVVQHGTSRAPRLAEHRRYVGYQQMEELLDQASAVVCHGGPGSVMMCRWAGKRPIVVPRRRSLGEHVDDHQMVFARRIAQEGEITLAEDEASLAGCLERALAGEGSLDMPAEEHRVAEAVARFEELVGRLTASRR
jgi:UDP-N-acetylglucosamine transferase subunit ALG13